ncbi:Uncharacterized protein YR821_0571 [Yersinia ruckeri]|uniref:Uncharacterized protein n=1 Tax=Yersinia ruckeri TaxID=29486 RepID=A0A0A8VDG2_YERRU|nr:Uncharacterized protein YR821_0571 [Yersinia ruckeri]CEK26398.1 hypothetical protein CSF007_3095 [Yersinia ruckeri]
MIFPHCLLELNSSILFFLIFYSIKAFFTAIIICHMALNLADYAYE